MLRTDHLKHLEHQVFDLCIIGGGASGVGAALDAALRGMKVVLIEKNDFAAETSSRSTKLIHGGVRYLEQAIKNLDFAQLRQVRHGLAERHTVLRNAPHLTRPLALVTPVSTWIEGLYFSIGLKMYDWFASGKDTLPGSNWLTKKEALDRLPGLSKKMHSAVLYYDGQLDDARYALALAQAAAQAGAIVLNHAAVTEFQKDDSGKLKTALVTDQLTNSTFRVNARTFLNCCGPCADTIRIMANPHVSPRIRPSKGVHITLPADVTGSVSDAILIPKTSDGRVVFAVPFAGKLMVGTTDTEINDLHEEPAANAAEVDFLLETLNRYLEKPALKNQVSAGFGGLRPLISAKAAPGTSTKTLLRDHEVERDAVSGLISLMGGKWTTYRLMARDAVDAVCQQTGCDNPCITEEHYLPGAIGWSADLPEQLTQEFGVSLATARHLSHNYGSLARTVLAMTAGFSEGKELILPDFPFLKIEIAYAVQHEMACTLRDFLARRIRLELLDWEATTRAVPVVAEWMAKALDWTDLQREQAAQAYLNLLKGFQANLQ